MLFSTELRNLTFVLRQNDDGITRPQHDLAKPKGSRGRERERDGQSTKLLIGLSDFFSLSGV